MKKIKHLYNVIRRWNRMQKYRQWKRRRICMSMLDFQYAPVADVNPLTGRFVREDNGMQLY